MRALINVFFNGIKDKLALEVKKSASKLIFFIEFDRFTILLSILLPSSFSLVLVQTNLTRANIAVVFNIKRGGTAILLKPLINHL